MRYIRRVLEDPKCGQEGAGLHHSWFLLQTCSLVSCSIWQLGRKWLSLSCLNFLVDKPWRGDS